MDMIDKKTVDYLEKNILKKHEKLEFILEVNELSSLIDIKIVKQTKRTYRVLGLLTLFAGHDNEGSAPDDALMKLHFTPRKKANLDDHSEQTLRWLEQGWVIKEIRFTKDEKTIQSKNYRMGHPLFVYQNHLELAKKDAIQEDFNKWKSNLDLLQISTRLHTLASKRRNGIHSLTACLKEIYPLEVTELEISEAFPVDWTIKKRRKFLHFVLAFIQLSLNKAEFDWKEIGAHYYKKIGGSKEFDTDKQEFVSQLEEWSQCPASFLGLTSFGKITPLYFSGHMAGTFSIYQHGPVHALTDLAIYEEQYQTNAKVLWLVENRAVLTRMSATKDFLQSTNSLILCVDGHLRTSHRQCIQQLLSNSKIEQVIIWSDYDQDGFGIAYELYAAVTEQNRPRIKWITHNHEMATTWEDYAEQTEEFLKSRKMEQEQVLGGATDWKKWINH